MLKPTFKHLPHSGRRYLVNQLGTVVGADGNALPTKMVNGYVTVDLAWVDGVKGYPVASLVLVTFGITDLPDYHWNEIEALYIDGNPLNIHLDNLTYRFRNAPLEVDGKPGYYYIPFYEKYAINTDGVMITIATDRVKSWAKTTPDPIRNSKGGYSYTRAVRPNGTNGVLFRHRLLCLTFMPYEANVHGLIVNHLDGEPENDSLDNLEWSTYSENNRHACNNGLKPNGTKPVLVKDLKTGEIVRYPTVVECAKALGHKTSSTIYYRLLRPNTKLHSDWLQFKYDDGSEWLEIKMDSKVKRNGHGEIILAKRVATGEIIKFVGAGEGEKLTGVKRGTISAHIARDSQTPTCGYYFRYEGSDLNWPEAA